ncbi:MAG TPA: hypothetical protein RMH85_17990 [Polyangiaceae bacterium LLY-WYZ-15_(1-7)]|nr:hypothetical protein [Myxococcales bacterium]MAT27990.1 hypothetical protein [Sandaracinus sp.]HJL02804.1 hypothetical protein [Polyangiaceae bacterium LLY-WYZ-15_(1-7)]MBJ70981.1 hypothetical protein [Sandaracinus sp.]HJL10396.1 hypothetical protein [Polyangiaceae bacterium LLY-WYZ-15_(1-7)]
MVTLEHIATAELGGEAFPTRLATSPDGQRVVALRGTAIVFDRALRRVGEANLGGPHAPAVALTALDEGFVVMSEEHLTRWSFEGELQAQLDIEPWGAGLQGALARAHGRLWSVHLPEGAPESGLPWVLAMHDPETLAVRVEIDLGHTEATHFALHEASPGVLGIDLYQAPDYIGTLTLPLEEDGELSEPVHRPEDIGDVHGYLGERLLGRTPWELVLADAESGDTLGRSKLEEVFGAGPDGSALDDLERGWLDPHGRVLIHTRSGFVGELVQDGAALRFERWELEGLEVQRESMRVTGTGGRTHTIEPETTRACAVQPLGADALVAELFAQRGDHPQPAQLMTWKLPPA